MPKSAKSIGTAIHMQAGTRLRKTAHRLSKADRVQEVLNIARETGLLKGARTELVRGRMPKALVAKAKARSGVQSDTKLIEVALANLALADDYPAWLLAQHGAVSKDVDLEF